MEPVTKIIALVFGPIFGFIGLFGWSHQNLNRKIAELTMKTNAIVPEEKIRQTIDDKLAPFSIEYRALSLRIDELKNTNQNLEHKIEKMLDLLRAHGQK